MLENTENIKREIISFVHNKELLVTNLKCAQSLPTHDVAVIFVIGQ